MCLAVNRERGGGVAGHLGKVGSHGPANVWTGRQTHVEQRNKRGFQRKALFAGALGLSAFALAGCEVDGPGGPLGKFLRFGWPEGITPEAHAMGNFYVWVWVAAWAVGLIMWGLLLYSGFAHTAKRGMKKHGDEFPRQTQYNVPLELVLTAVPVLIVSVLFFFTVQAQDKVTAMDKNPEVTVDVTGFQWNWKFGYQKVGKELTPNGQDYNGVDQQRTAAAKKSAEQPGPIHGHSKSDMSYLHYNQIETVGTSKEIPVLVLPSNTPIEFQLASSDVSHAFWVPEFLFKKDVYAHPEQNMSNRSFQIEKIQKEGAFVGRCAEMCGTYHSMMNFELRVVSPEKFKQYMAFRMNNPQALNSQALEAIGEAPFATSTHPFVTGRTDSRAGENSADPAAAASGAGATVREGA